MKTASGNRRASPRNLHGRGSVARANCFLRSFNPVFRRFTALAPGCFVFTGHETCAPDFRKTQDRQPRDQLVTWRHDFRQIGCCTGRITILTASSMLHELPAGCPACWWMPIRPCICWPANGQSFPRRRKSDDKK
jgi:hypothetical protein